MQIKKSKHIKLNMQKVAILDDYHIPIQDLEDERDELEMAIEGLHKRTEGVSVTDLKEIEDRISWIESIIDERSFAKGGHYYT